MNDFLNFVDSTSDELAANESFQAFVFLKNEEDIVFWERFINLHPGKKADVDQAVQILSLLTFKKNNIPVQLKELELNRLLYCISLNGKEKNVLWPHHKGQKINWKPSSWYGIFDQRRHCIAALLISVPIIFFCVAFFLGDLFVKDETIICQTTYGETSTFILPDSSVVILNGNTRLRHEADWDNNKMREVWLDGEAFFDVRHKGPSVDAGFVVHTPGMDVEVLGTKFNVFNRDEKASVVLNAGQVKVNIGAKQGTSSVLMVPDEAVEYFRKDHTITRKQVNAEVLTSWRNKVLVFENTPLYKISEMIEHTYGVKVIFSSDVDTGEELAGTIPNENLDVLLTVLAKSSNLSIIRKIDEIIIERKTPISSKP